MKVIADTLGVARSNLVVRAARGRRARLPYRKAGDPELLVRLKMMTKPGEQFVIRRRAYAMIKKAFVENGIEIALPTVQVAGGSEGSTAAAARQGLELVQPPATNT